MSPDGSALDARLSAARRAGFTVRDAVAADAPRIGVVHAQAWHEAYPGLLPAATLAKTTAQARAERWLKFFDRPDRVERNVVGLDADGLIVGFGTVGPAREGDAPAQRELWSLYVLAATYSSGLGDVLIDALLGGDAAYLWTLEGNNRAHAFYRRHGFVADGVAKPDFDAGCVDLRMSRPARKPNHLG